MAGRVIPREITEVRAYGTSATVEYYEPRDGIAQKTCNTVDLSQAKLPLRGAGRFAAPRAGVHLVEWVVDDEGRFFATKNRDVYHDREGRMSPIAVDDLLRLVRGSSPEWEEANRIEVTQHLSEPAWKAQARAAGWAPPA